MRRHIATQDAELLDLLDRILDKGLFLGSANLLTLGDTDLSGSQSRISVISMYTNADSYSTPPRAAAFAGQTLK
ncbi:MAG TPA: hypothetical protein VFY05_07485 [Candidatus Angelobacter sp.]|nr:hypothetical protein [Candidatus Angelobacter sp.]